MKQKVPVINRNTNDDSRFLCSLMINEMWLVDVHPDNVTFDANDNLELLSIYLCRVQKMSENLITLNRHINVSEYDPNTKIRVAFNKSPSTIQGMKVKISPIGRIEKSED